MSMLIKSGKQYYEIPAAALKKFKITKKKFENGKKCLSAEVSGQPLVMVAGGGGGGGGGGGMCTSKKSLWASC